METLAPEYADWPKLLLTAIGCKCPVCGREWELNGGGQGFVKVGARKHVGSCFQKQLANRGFEIGNWSDEKQAHILVPIGHYKSVLLNESASPKGAIKNDPEWPWPINEK